jgi:hypothetical protein
MDNQHQKIKGYRDLSQTEIDLMNAIKAKGAELEALVASVNDHVRFQQAMAHASQHPRLDSEKADVTDAERIAKAEPARWAAMARTDLQTGIMKLVRAVAQPTD